MRAPRSSSTAQFHSRRLLIAIAALSLLAMPMDYRGGADVAHAHAFLQFWGSGADEAHNHHHADDAHHPELANDFSATSAERLAGALGTLFPTADNLFVNADPDVPTVSEMTATAELGSGIAVGMAALFALLILVGAAPIGTRVSFLTGRLPCPESPPPRGVAVAALGS